MTGPEELKETHDYLFPIIASGWLAQKKICVKKEILEMKMSLFTIESGTIQTDCPFAAFIRDLLLQPSFLEISQVGPFQ